MKKQEVAKIAINKVKEILEKLKIPAEITASAIENNTKIYINIDIQGEDLGLLIGYRGIVLNSLEQVVLMMLVKELKSKEDSLDKSIKIIIDINNYRKRKEETIKETALKAIEQAIESKQEVELPVMSPAERRIVHLTVQNEERGIVTYSKGEEGERRVVIKPEN